MLELRDPAYNRLAGHEFTRQCGPSLPEVVAACAAVHARSASAAGERDLRRELNPMPGPQDLLDGISMAAPARGDIDRAELALIDAARAAGVGWYQIGLALGHPQDRAVTAAQNRRRQLVRHTMPVPDGSSAGAMASASEVSP